MLQDLDFIQTKEQRQAEIDGLLKPTKHKYKVLIVNSSGEFSGLPILGSGNVARGITCVRYEDDNLNNVLSVGQVMKAQIGERTDVHIELYDDKGNEIAPSYLK